MLACNHAWNFYTWVHQVPRLAAGPKDFVHHGGDDPTRRKLAFDGPVSDGEGSTSAGSAGESFEKLHESPIAVNLHA